MKLLIAILIVILVILGFYYWGLMAAQQREPQEIKINVNKLDPINIPDDYPEYDGKG